MLQMKQKHLTGVKRLSYFLGLLNKTHIASNNFSKIRFKPVNRDWVQAEIEKLDPLLPKMFYRIDPLFYSDGSKFEFPNRKPYVNPDRKRRKSLAVKRKNINKLIKTASRKIADLT